MNWYTQKHIQISHIQYWCLEVCFDTFSEQIVSTLMCFGIFSLEKYFFSFLQFCLLKSLTTQDDQEVRSLCRSSWRRWPSLWPLIAEGYVLDEIKPRHYRGGKCKFGSCETLHFSFDAEQWRKWVWNHLVYNEPEFGFVWSNGPTLTRVLNHPFIFIHLVFSVFWHVTCNEWKVIELYLMHSSAHYHSG